MFRKAMRKLLCGVISFGKITRKRTTTKKKKVEIKSTQPSKGEMAAKGCNQTTDFNAGMFTCLYLEVATIEKKTTAVYNNLSI